VTLFEATFIADGGEISVAGSFPNGDVHTFLLVPCEGHEKGCIEDCRRITAAKNAVTVRIPSAMSAFDRIRVGGALVPGSRMLRSRKLFRARTFSTQK
jgi:hypothetical protein